MIPPVVERRLRDHVAAILAASHVPSAERSDLGDEIFSHLVERYRQLVDDGVDPIEASERSITDFGPPKRIGSELLRTYRGRVYASTIGVLVPATAAAGDQPRLAWWLGVSLRFYAVMAAL